MPERGRIYSHRIVEYDSWAECGRCGCVISGLPAPGARTTGYPTQTEFLLTQGWRRTSDGWACPDCLGRKRHAWRGGETWEPPGPGLWVNPDRDQEVIDA